MKLFSLIWHFSCVFFSNKSLPQLVKSLYSVNYMSSNKTIKCVQQLLSTLMNVYLVWLVLGKYKHDVTIHKQGVIVKCWTWNLA